MTTTARLDFDELLEHLMLVGFLGLVAWALVAAFGFIAGVIQVEPQAALRFLLAVLILVFTRRTYWEIRQWRSGKLPPDERFGFAAPISEHPRVSEFTLQRTGENATGSPQAAG
jgi:hypothetical protein